VAAGSLLITEAGGLVGNFTGESDYLHQREIVAGNPKVYGQLVTMLSPYTRVIKEGKDNPGASAVPDVAADPKMPQPDATAAFIVGQTLDAPAPAKRTVRIRKPG
jgi:myo-inositol-1(or 4)-monophosphatase